MFLCYKYACIDTKSIIVLWIGVRDNFKQWETFAQDLKGYSGIKQVIKSGGKLREYNQAFQVETRCGRSSMWVYRENEKLGPFSFGIFAVLPTTSTCENIKISNIHPLILCPGIFYSTCITTCAVGQNTTVIGFFLPTPYSQVTWIVVISSHLGGSYLCAFQFWSALPVKKN